MCGQIRSVSGDYPVSVNEEGIKIKEQSMEPERLYHCIFEKKVYLFYKDEAGLNCYEIDDPDAVKEISENPSDLENILKKRAGI
jgi:hypothetical protein